ncbi:Glutamate synthase [NADPH] large chain [hydrothermal vent metagenome]|uniref:Glutamate synthase [NADPH] large chain n=1 Tax=hydrothermal vent metagenome TaxID=652676 RepID=A0A3B1DRQ3_9ZZZZ
MSKTTTNTYSKPLFLNTKNIDDFKNKLKEYFLNTYNLYENLFSLLKTPDAMYNQPNKLRHPLIFYYGHTAVFFINKMITAKLIDKRINKKFENIFSIGVDEMMWDDLNQQNYQWPKIQEIQEYRDKVKDIVLEAIQNADITLPINDKSSIWIILMAIEHENIHIETSSVLIRELDIKFVKTNKNFKPYANKIQNKYPKNELLKVDGGVVNLGRDKKNPLVYGWDNEFGQYQAYIQDFKASKYLVSNGEFLEFIKDNGYKNNTYWSDEAIEWKNKLKNKIPHFWIKKDNTYYLRNISDIVLLPLNHPVEVNQYEASAFCKYKSEKLGTKTRLPTEDEYARLQDSCNINTDANIGLKYASTTPVDTYKFDNFYDVIGNVWQWSNTPIYPFKDFESHYAYDDFSIPTFDDKHIIMNGGSFASVGNVALCNSRYAFRKYFFQHSGFRYVQSDNIVNKIKNNNTYENDELLGQYCEFHYGENYFGVDNFMKKSINIVKEFIDKNNIQTTKAMDLGCSVGRATFELANIFDSVVGIDFSANFINMALKLKNEKKLRFNIPKEGQIKEAKEISLESINLNNTKGSIHFAQGDACNLKDIFNSYDVIFCSNLLDRLYDPQYFLSYISSRLNKNGLLVISSPYTWLEEYTPKEKWIGGYKKNNKHIYTIDALREKLVDFEQLHKEDIEFVIRETSRKYQHSIAQMSIWRKK